MRFIMKNIIIVFVLFMQLACADTTYYLQNNKKVKLTPFEQKSRTVVDNKMDFYINDNNVVLGVSDKLMLKLKDDSNLNTYLLEFNLTILKKITTNLYLLKTTNKSETISISKLLANKSDVVFSHPDFLKNISHK